MPSDPKTRYKPVKPLFTKAERKKLDTAFKRFAKKKEQFDAAASDAKKTVALTMAWVGVGEKVVSLANTVIQKRLEGAPSTEEKKKLGKLEGKLRKFAELADILSVDLPGIV